MKSNNGPNDLRFSLYIFAVGGAAIVCAMIFSLLDGAVVPTASAQQDPFLSQRINQIESRFTSIESRLNRLELPAPRLPALTPQIGENNDAEIRLLRAQIETLQFQLAEAECGLQKLDERTLTTAARQARRKSPAAETERCRLNSNAPLQLPAQP